MAGRGSGVYRWRAASQSHYFALLPQLRCPRSGSPAGELGLRSHSALYFLRKDARLALGVFPGVTQETLPLDGSAVEVRGLGPSPFPAAPGAPAQCWAGTSLPAPGNQSP